MRRRSIWELASQSGKHEAWRCPPCCLGPAVLLRVLELHYCDPQPWFMETLLGSVHFPQKTTKPEAFIQSIPLGNHYLCAHNSQAYSFK